MDNKTPPPIQQGHDDVSIHLSYLRRDMDEMKQASKESFNSIKLSLDELKGLYVTRDEYKSLEEKVDKLQDYVEKHLATKEEVDPIKKGFWGFLGTSGVILLGFVINYFLTHK